MTTPAHDLSRLRIDRDPPPEVRRAFGRTVLLAGAALIVIAAAILYNRSRSAPRVTTVVATAAGGASQAGTAAGATLVTANGYVVARTRASVAAKVAGRLASLSVDGGSVVRRGEVIARLENADYQAAVAEARANLRSAEASLIEATTERDPAARESRRTVQIHSERPELISAQDAEAANSRTGQADARVRAAAARVEAARAAMGFAEATLENTYIRAPFSGTVLRKEAEVGEVVAPSVGGGLTRGAVVTMADLSTLEVEVDVNEAYIARVHSGQDARITLDAYPDTAFRGSVRQVVPTADRQRATVQVKVSILDHDSRILPEMGARVDFVAAADSAASTAARTAGPGVFRLPAAAVREQGGRTVVWIVREGKLEPRPVDAGPVSGDFREVRRGLSGGELVVTGGVEAPSAGMRVSTEGR
jgi:RND family efflux transporter MFP subunit